MAKLIKTLAATLALLLVTTSCVYHHRHYRHHHHGHYGHHHHHSKEAIGTLGGAVVGGLLGSRIGSGKGRLIATGAGVLVGALIGGSVGRGLDDVDRIKAKEASDKAHAAPIGETITWNNPDSQKSGSVTPLRDGTSTSGKYCREYQQTVTIGGKTEKSYGTACRQPDGSWQVAN